MKLGISTKRQSVTRHIGRLEGETVLDLGPGNSLNAVMSRVQDTGPVGEIPVAEVEWQLPFQVSSIREPRSFSSGPLIVPLASRSPVRSAAPFDVRCTICWATFQ